MTPDAPIPTLQRYEAVARLRAGGAGQLEAHGLVAPFDATAGRVADLAGPVKSRVIDPLLTFRLARYFSETHIEVVPPPCATPLENHA